MATLTVTLAEELISRAQTQAIDAGFASVDEYLANLIKSDIVIPLDPALEADILAAKNSIGREMFAQEWESKKQRLRAQFGKGSEGAIPIPESLEADFPAGLKEPCQTMTAADWERSLQSLVEKR